MPREGCQNVGHKRVSVTTVRDLFYQFLRLWVNWTSQGGSNASLRADFSRIIFERSWKDDSNVIETFHIITIGMPPRQDASNVYPDPVRSAFLSTDLVLLVLRTTAFTAPTLECKLAKGLSHILEHSLEDNSDAICAIAYTIRDGA